MGVSVQESNTQTKPRKRVTKSYNTTKKDKFVELLLDPNTTSATDAAEKAGFSQNRLRQTAYDLLQKPDIKDRLAERKAELAALANTTPEQIVGGVVELAYDMHTGEKTRLGALKTLGGWNGLDTEPGANPNDLKAQIQIEMALQYVLPERAIRYEIDYKALPAQAKVELMAAMFAENGVVLAEKLLAHAIKFAETL